MGIIVLKLLWEYILAMITKEGVLISPRIQSSGLALVFGFGAGILAGDMSMTFI